MDMSAALDTWVDAQKTQHVAETQLDTWEDAQNTDDFTDSALLTELCMPCAPENTQTLATVAEHTQSLTPSTCECPTCMCVKPADEFIFDAGRVRSCKTCHGVRSRINRLRSSTQMGELKSFTMKGMSTEERIKFFRDNADNTTTDFLAAKMNETVVKAKRRSMTQRFVETGVFLDKEDLEEKYKHKPGQLASILQNARKCNDPVRGVTLYEDVEMKAMHEEKKVQEFSQESALHVAYDAGGMKGIGKGGKDKGIGKDPDAPNVGVLRKLSKAQVKKLQEASKVLTVSTYTLTQTLRRAKKPENAAIVPKYLLDGSEQSLAPATETVAALKSILDANKCQDGEADDLLEKAKEHTDASGKNGTLINNLLDAAVDLMHVGNVNQHAAAMAGM